MAPRRSGRRATGEYRVRLRAAAGSGFYGGYQVRLLRMYLGATTFLFVWGVLFTWFPVRQGLTLSNTTGGVIAIILGVAALVWLWVRPHQTGPATAAAIAATPIVMAFHRTITAEFACLIGPMVLAMYLRAFYPPRQAGVLVGVLTTASVVALAVAPTPTLYIDYAIFVIAIVGASESFGVITRALVTAACTDPLTGVLNRAGWEIAIADLFARTRSAAATVTVVAMDIDNFKHINDTLGHLAGDDHLIDRADSWRRFAPARTVFARLGGDEFAACIVDRPGQPSTAQQFISDIRSQTPGTSIGVASYSGADGDITALLDEADADLYAAKARRRGDDVQ